MLRSYKWWGEKKIQGFQNSRIKELILSLKKKPILEFYNHLIFKVYLMVEHARLIDLEE